jgi:hypothetical protein
MVTVGTATGATISCSDNQSNTYTKAVESPTVGSSKNVSVIFYTVTKATSGTFTVTVSSSGSAGSTYLTCVALEYYGVAQTSPLDQTNSNSGTSIGTLATGNITTTSLEELIVANCTSNLTISGTWTDPGAPWTQRYIESNGAAFEMGIGDDQIVTTTGTYSATFVINTSLGSLTAAIASFKAGTMPPAAFMGVA